MIGRGIAGAAVLTLLVTAAVGVVRAEDDEASSSAKVLSQPLRFYVADEAQWPATGFVGLAFDLSDGARVGLLSTPYSTFQFTVPAFCRNKCTRWSCRWRCRIGLYYVWPEDSFDNWQPRYRVQAANAEGEWFEGLEEANVSCDVNGSSGCPCWFLPRVDPLEPCEARPDRSTGAFPAGVEHAAPIFRPFPVPFPVP